MNYYSHNIGDYAQATMHLSLIEDAIYTRLLRRYYAEEQPIIDDLVQVCRWVGARSTEEREAVPVVLAEFFELQDGSWHNKRADEEIAKYHAKAKQAAENGKRGGRPKKPTPSNPEPGTPQPGTGPANSDNPAITNPVNSANPEKSGLEANQEPRTNNQEPEDQTPCAPPAHDPEPKADLFDRFWNLYPNKKNKSNARKAWAKLKVTDHLFDQIVAGLARYCASPDWTKDGGQFIPHPTTWLNGKRWEDEVALPTSNVHKFPGNSRHSGFDDRDYTKGLTPRGDGTYDF